MRKLFLFLCAALMSVGMFATTVTWNSSTLSSIYLETGQSFTKDGVTLTVVDGLIDGMIGVWSGEDNALFRFSTSSGNFTRIEITGGIWSLVGSGWTEADPGAVWTGEANQTAFGNNFTDVSQIVFTIEEPEPEPEPEPAGTEVTITNSDFPSWGQSFTKDGVTVSAGYAIDGQEGNIMGGGSFSTTLGNFTKIEISAMGVFDLGGEGWSIAPGKATWTGNASSVSFTGDAMGGGQGTTLIFTIGGSEPEPEPEPAGDEITVTWNDPSGYGFEFTQDGVTLTCGEISSIDFYGPGTFTTDLGNFTKIEVYAEGGCYLSGDGWSGDINQKTWTGNAASVSFSDDIYALTSIVFTIEPAAAPEPEPAGQNYNLTLADGSNEHGSVAFSVGGNDASQAKKDDVVTVSVNPNEGYSAKDVSVRAYTSWEAASDILAGGGNNLVSDIDVAKNNEDGTWSFTMPAANVWVVVSYSKNLQDSWIQAIDNQTYSGEAITPAVEVMDGESVLVLNSDYTVAYSNNVNAGIATVTITAVEGSNYSGSASKTFEILKAANSWITAPAAVEGLIYSGEAQTLITAGEALFGTELYSLDGENYSEDLPQATNAGSYTVYYKAEGDANHNGIDAQSLNVTIAPDKSALNNAISDAEAYYGIIAESNPDIANELLNAINAAKGVRDDANATQSEVNDAIAALNNAKATAEAKIALNNIISEAEQYHNSISESNPDIAATLLDAINAAKGVQGNDDATLEQIDAATQTLTDALNAAKAEVALKRITVVIPAKSYMARIDADKRQIEVAVEGVSLYSVQSVTSTEVILTDELSVIAAEMPYFIYNDNDMEMEVSLIVSNADADDVDYDSEHFKGTLVDKTFTDEDMAEKDYYVLSDNSFVWVMNAGTLAAGKCWIEVGESAAYAPRLIIVSKGDATGISNIEAGSATKVLRDGQVLILRGDKTYTVQGAEVK